MQDTHYPSLEKYTSRILRASCLLVILLLTACTGDFEGKKSNNIAMEPRDLILTPMITGTREQSDVIELRNTGEAILRLSDIYLEVGDASNRTRLDDCDFKTQMIPPETILTPDVLPTCTIILRERPEVPISLMAGQLKQITVTYRPLDGIVPPENIQLVVESNASNELKSITDITISSGQPDISGNKTAIQFPSTGRSSDNYLLRNFGSSPLNLSAVNIVVDPEYPAPASGIEFSVDSTEEFRGASIEPNGYLNLIISYDPQDEGVDQAKLVISSNDPDQPNFEVLLTSEARPANLEIMPVPVTFAHEAGQTDIQAVIFYNTGLRPISAFLSIEPDNSEYQINSADNDSFQVGVQAEQIIRIDYIAGATPTEATLVVRSDDADNAMDGEFRVPLRTQLSSSLKLLDADVSMLSFDGVSAGDSASAMLSITSSGDSAVNLSEMAIEGSPLDVSTFSIIGEQTGMIEPGETKIVEIVFNRPEDEMVANAYQANLVVRSDSDGGDILITLIANP